MTSSGAPDPRPLPTFLGIGAPKAGTTWLTELLMSHPDVAMSPHRKEIHYFDLHFDKGLDWYQHFFEIDPGHPPIAIGEFTPHYLYTAAVPARVRTMPSIDRFVLVLRNPVDRAFSHYRFRLRQDNDRATFEEFVAANPTAVDWGRYGRYLVPWFDEFTPEQLLVLVFEQAVHDPDGTRRRLAEHLGIDAGRFPPDVVGPSNEAFVPRSRHLYGAAVNRARWLRRHNLDPLITAAKRAGLVRLVKRPDAAATNQTLSEDQRRRLWDSFEEDVQLTERLTGLDLGFWRPGPEVG
jgi:Sulfotransferase domain